MKKTVLTYGFISGAMIVVIGAITFMINHKDGKFDMSMGMLYGYANMIISLSMVFFGIRHYRDKYLGGKISFKTALWVGLLIALIASCCYVIAWMIYYAQPGVAENFTQQFIEHMQGEWAKSGKTSTEIAELTAKTQADFENYKNPLVRVAFTFFEILPVVFVVTVVSALILKRK